MEELRKKSAPDIKLSGCRRKKRLTIALVGVCFYLSLINVIASDVNAATGSENTGMFLQQQQRSITGTVVDKQGIPLPGVSIVLKGTTTGTITDVNGNYHLADVPDNGILVFSFIGMATQEITLAGSSKVDVQMVEDSLGLDEVVVVGYGTQKKASLTSAISQIKGEEALKNKGVNNVTVALQGEIPGLVITRTSTRPGV